MSCYSPRPMLCLNLGVPVSSLSWTCRREHVGPDRGTNGGCKVCHAARKRERRDKTPSCVNRNAPSGACRTALDDRIPPYVRARPSVRPSVSAPVVMPRPSVLVSETPPCVHTSARSNAILPDQTPRLLAAQGGRCAVCLAARGPGKRSDMLVDHDHTTGRVRGLVCHPCNLVGGPRGMVST